MSVLGRGSIGRASAVTVAVGVLGITAVTPAHAEGERRTSLSNIAAGFRSKQWYDGNADDWRTAIVLKGCSSNSPQAAPVLQVYRNRRLYPDAKYGKRGYYGCGHKWVRGDWGRRKDKGYYYFKAENMGADFYRVSARDVRIYW
ncbi:hypothetical protein [Actinomadura roseirufa]|uniref:hypothetical protein n=1 Tax=Actinomadura roseirufa TaxID=2094049 RepID=UPI001040F89C|nr:hypothetical protein [Actinomadura roseirufa]